MQFSMRNWFLVIIHVEPVEDPTENKGEGKKMNPLSSLLSILIIAKEIGISILVKIRSNTAFRRKIAYFSKASHTPCLSTKKWQSFGSSPANQWKWWTPWHLHLAICFRQHTKGCQPLALAILTKMKPLPVQLTPCTFLLHPLQNHGYLSW